MSDSLTVALAFALRIADEGTWFPIFHQTNREEIGL